jgi:hypothetical protein
MKTRRANKIQKTKAKKVTNIGSKSVSYFWLESERLQNESYKSEN